MDNVVVSIKELLGIPIAIATIITLSGGALWAIYFNRIKEGQKAEFLKQIESLKSHNDKVNYISKTQFDAEFKIYQELSEKSFLMLVENELLFPRGLDYVPLDEKERKELFEKRYERARDTLIIYQNLLYKYAPFISIDLYNMFENLRKLAHEQLKWYPDFVLGRTEQEVLIELRDERRKCVNRTKEISDLHEKIIVELRNYLNSLQIQEK